MLKFSLPTMPFRRDISSGCPVGTSIQVTGKPLEAVDKTVQLTLSTNNNDVALRIELLFGAPSRMKIDCIVSQKTSTPIENLVVCSYDQNILLQIKTLQHSFQIFFNGAKVADFVHRVDPSLIKSIQLRGSLITHEVLIEPAASAPLPSYEQATSPPVDLMNNLRLGPQKAPIPDAPPTLGELPPPPPQNVIHPTPVAGQMPIPGTNNTSTSSSSFFYTGGSQGFSNHPYPLPGLIDNATYPSQQNTVHPLPATSIPSAPPAPAPASAPISTGQFVTAPVTNPPTSSSSSSSSAIPSHIYTPTPISTPSLPYTVTFPQSASATPAAPPISQQQPLQQQQQQMPPHLNPIYQNQLPPNYNPYQTRPPMVPQQAPPTMHPNYPAASSGALVPTQPYPVPVGVPAQVPPTYIYPQATPMIQPYPVYQQYPGYYTPEVVYYEGHHHHHRHHFFGHHHHHCD